MEDLLFLAHRIPYPPNKGDKIRSYHLLRHFSKHYRVHLATFVDDPNDWQYEDVILRMCADACLVSLKPKMAKLHAMRALFGESPISVGYFRNRRLARWVESVIEREKIRRLFVYSSSMAQYVLRALPRDGLISVLDFVDVDSDKWFQYSSNKRWPLSALYAREGRTLERYERVAAMTFDASVFVSEAEANLFRRIAPECAERIGFVENGVDADYFSPHRQYPDPYAGNRSVFVFTGAMDYWANVDAVKWFALEVFPLIRSKHIDARFFIVGSSPTREVLQLADPEGNVVVTGRVEDVRPFLAHARAAVAPLRIARGVQNKVLEALAMARPTIATPQALEGLVFESSYPLVAEHPRVWVDLVTSVIDGTFGHELGAHLREWVLKRYAWEPLLESYVKLFKDCGG